MIASRPGRLSAAFALLCLSLSFSGAATAAPPAAGTTAAPRTYKPRPISDAEREASRVALAYLTEGPEAVWASLSTRSPLRLLGHDEALKEIAVRCGPRAKAEWELKTPHASVPASVAIFETDSPAGLDQTLVFELAEEAGKWKVHALRTLAEPPTSVLRRRASAGDAAAATQEPVVPNEFLLAGAAVGVALVFLPLAFFQRRRLALAAAFGVLGLAGLGASLVLVTTNRGGVGVTRRRAEAPIVRLAALQPLRDRLETEGDSEGAAALDSLPNDERLRDVAALWLAQTALSRMALDEADGLLKRFGSPSPAPWADVLRARLAFLRNKQTDAGLAYANAVASGPRHDGLLIEAQDVLTLLGFDSERARYVDELASSGSRSATSYYRLAAHAVELDREDEAETAFAAGWKLRPGERREVVSIDGLWPVLRKPSILPSLGLDATDEPAGTVPPRDVARALSTPPGGKARVCGAQLSFAMGETTFTIPGGAELAPVDAEPERAGAERKRDEEHALNHLDELAKKVTPAAFARPALRQEIRVAATALARRNRWRELASLTAGVTGAEEQVPPDLVMIRAEALRRTSRAEMGRQVLVALAKSTGFERRTLPMVVYRVGEMFASFEDFDLAVRYIEKGLKGSKKERAVERIRRLKTEQKLLKVQAVYPSSHFEIHYPPETAKQTAAEAARILELERERLEKEVPSDVMRPVDVQLLWFDEFQETFSGSEHVVGLYDGKIRVPLAGVITWTPPLVSIMTHELAHALVAQATEDRAPHWFQEGIAQHLEMRKFRPNHVGFYKESGRALAIPVLEDVLRTMPDWDLVEEGYQEAEWILGYMETRYGAAGVRRMIAAFRDGLTSEEAFPKALGVSMNDFTEGFFVWSVRDAPKMLTSPVISYLSVEGFGKGWTK